MKHAHSYKLFFLSFSLLLLTACGDSINDNATTAATTQTDNLVTLTGSVPGTLIEAYGENGSYYKITSTDNGTAEHPFSLKLPKGVAFYLFMTVNENTENSITTVIGHTSLQQTSFSIGRKSAMTSMDFGHLNIDTDRTNDRDNDGISDNVYDISAVDNIKWATRTAGTTTTWDADGDGIHNSQDKDYVRKASDSDGDGLPDSVDINPYNRDYDDNVYPIALDRDRDGYLDNDRDRDGYHDDDNDRDGYRDNDNDRDGYDDDDKDHDGYRDDDNDRDGYRDNDNDRYGEIKATVSAINGYLITVNIYRTEGISIPNRNGVVVDVSNTRFEHTSLARLGIGHRIEVKGNWHSASNRFIAYKLELD